MVGISGNYRRGANVGRSRNYATNSSAANAEPTLCLIFAVDLKFQPISRRLIF